MREMLLGDRLSTQIAETGLLGGQWDKSRNLREGARELESSNLTTPSLAKIMKRRS